MRDTDDLPVIVDGRAVARVIINHDKQEATRAACEAAYHLSTPGDIQFCTFSDGSQGRDNRGGAALAYQYPWLPHGWDPEDQATAPNENMVHKAWAFEHATTSLGMEGVGVLESLCAANDELQRHLPVLIKHASTVNVKTTTDSQLILRYISTGMGKKARTIPPQLIKKMRELILGLHGHGIKVNVELHWCPRNAVPPMCTADALANKAMNDGRGFCNVTKNIWYKATQSVIMKELEPMLLGTVRFARLPVSQVSTGAGSTGASSGTAQQKKKPARHGSRSTQQAQAPQVSKPQSSNRVTTFNAEAMTSNAEVTTSYAGQTTFNAGASTIASVAPVASIPVKVEAGKRKAEEDTEESDGKPIKKVKLSPAETGKQQTEVEEMEDSEGKANQEAKRSPAKEKAETCNDRAASPTAGSGQQLAHTMPAAWRLAPTKTYIEDGRGVVREKLVHPAPYIRIELASTEETGERNVFINDGVSPFSLANPEGVYLEARMEAVWTVVSEEDGHEGLSH